MKTAETHSALSSRLKLPPLLLLCLLAAGCRHRRVQAPAAPPPPEIEQPVQPRPAQPGQAPGELSRIPLSETGIASWYGSPYHNARGANGKIYDEDAMTAAHRTLPLGTVVRVTNLATRQSAVVTITDRGPFIENRILDLSRAAALRIGVWRTGTAWVRIDVLSFPASAQRPGRWCVQIGALHREHTAKKLQDRLERQYPRARVIEFKGSTGYWVRIRPPGESHRDALAVAKDMRLTEGDAYVVRLD